MDYSSLKVKDGNIDTVARKVVLTKAEIERATARVNETQGLEIMGTRTTGKGISFMGPYDIVIGKYTYSEEKGRFVLKLNRNAEKQYEIQCRRAATKKAVRKFVLTKVLPLAGVCVIGGTFIFNYIQDAGRQVDINSGMESGYVDVADVNAVTLGKADIPIVMAWADYAMGEYYDDLNNSEYRENVMPFYERTYQEDFMPLHSAYENYYELKTSGLPDEMIGESAKNNLNVVRDSAERLNEDVPTDARFEETVFSHAIIIDEGADSKYAMDVDVYVPLAELKGTEYSLDNLPDDAIIYEGEVYVLSTHIYDQVKTNSKTN